MLGIDKHLSWWKFVLRRSSDSYHCFYDVEREVCIHTCESVSVCNVSNWQMPSGTRSLYWLCAQFWHSGNEHIILRVEWETLTSLWSRERCQYHTLNQESSQIWISLGLKSASAGVNTSRLQPRSPNKASARRRGRAKRHRPDHQQSA